MVALDGCIGSHKTASMIVLSTITPAATSMANNPTFEQSGSLRAHASTSSPPSPAATHLHVPGHEGCRQQCSPAVPRHLLAHGQSLPYGLLLVLEGHLPHQPHLAVPAPAVEHACTLAPSQHLGCSTPTWGLGAHMAVVAVGRGVRVKGCKRPENSVQSADFDGVKCQQAGIGLSRGMQVRGHTLQPCFLLAGRVTGSAGST